MSIISKMKGYAPLNQSEHPKSLPSTEHDGQRYELNKRIRSLWPGAVLALSLICNCIFLLQVFRLSSLSQPLALSREGSKSPHAQLERNKPIPIAQETPYGGHNLTEIRRLWEDISIDDGMIALPDEFARTHGLPPAQRYPWDHTKGLYFLNGYHNLHCLRAVHISLMEFAHGEPQSRRFQHVLHCMESLRQDIICNADDTPRYTTADAVPESGVGQVRQCRDWSKLESWAKEYNACYHFINQTATGFPNVLRYTWCPPNSRDVDEVERVMGGTNLTDLL